MAVTRLEIRARGPYANGAAFGAAGVYERIDGTIHFAVDPAHPANALIVDLDKAARDDAGQVRFSADFCLLQPVDATKANRRLLFEVLNRGRKLVPRMLNHAAPTAVPTEAIDPGDGFLLRHGWTLAWCGWQWDTITSAALMGLDAPEAIEQAAGSRQRAAERRPIQGQILIQFQPNERSYNRLLADRIHQPYPAADVDDPDAVLTVRDWPGSPRTTIPRDQWRFARGGKDPAPDETHLWLSTEFQPGKVYEVVYRTRRCPVVGTGLLAVRDSVSFLHHSDAADNPCAGRIDCTFGFGMSQSGRFLRHFLYLGLNLDEGGRPVFDGINIHVAGARRGEFNHRFAQPSQQNTPSFGHLMPFTDDDETDPLTGQTDGLLRRQRALGGVPKVIATNTSAEYWRGDASLLHTDIAGKCDVEPPEEARVYLFASTQHGLGTVPLVDTDSNTGARGVHGFNAVDYAPLLRAALVNLDRWVTDGTAPPPSVFPRLANGTAVPGASVFAAYHGIPGVTRPDPELLPTIHRFDLGPDAAKGIGRYPAVAGEQYPNYVSTVDADGNETGGVCMPDVAVPVATYTGWDPRHPATGGEGQIIPMEGSTFPFARTAEERQRTGDPRPSLVERYRDRADYLARVESAAEELVATRYLLAEDVSLAVAIAAERWDAFSDDRSL
ncbi:MAG: alpha/beta hydrolase domain-containing protein [Thermomicrobiales bacterium]